MPSFAGIEGFFGLSPRIKTVDNPTAEQVNKFFGTDGREALFGGIDGRVSLAKGVLFGVNLIAHNAAVESFRAYQHLGYFTLIDTRGVTWLYVKLHSFDPEERAPFLDARGYYTPYTATLHHLV